MQKLEDGNIFISGTNGADGLLLKITNEGNVIWHRGHSLYDETNNPTIAQFTHFYNVTPTSDGGYMAAGQYDSTPSDIFPQAIQTAIAVKIDEFGCLEPGCQLIDGLEEIILGLQDAMKIYPNPVQDVFNIEWSEEATPSRTSGDAQRLLVIGQLGRTVLEKNISSGSVAVALGVTGFETGLYTIHWLDGNTLLDSEKFIKE